jgi:hypothetical protein
LPKRRWEQTNLLPHAWWCYFVFYERSRVCPSCPDSPTPHDAFKSLWRCRFQQSFEFRGESGTRPRFRPQPVLVESGQDAQLLLSEHHTHAKVEVGPQIGVERLDGWLLTDTVDQHLPGRLAEAAGSTTKTDDEATTVGSGDSTGVSVRVSLWTVC